MEYTISCDTYSRFSNIVKKMHKNASAWCNGIYLENANGHSYAVASNRAIMAVEYIGTTAQPNGNATVIFEPGLLAQCDVEKAFNSTVTVVVNEMLRFSSARTTMGFNCTGNATLWLDGASELTMWRQFVKPEALKKSRGCMFLHTEHIALLGASSPTARLAFPEFIEASKHVVVTDPNDDRWLGVFMPDRIDDATGQRGEVVHKLPDWSKAV